MDALPLFWLASGVLELAVSVVFLALDFRSRLHRAFGLFLMLDGARWTVRALPIDGQLGAALDIFYFYLLLPIPYALLYVGAVYMDEHAGRRWARFAGPVLAAGALLSMAAILFRTEIGLVPREPNWLILLHSTVHFWGSAGMGALLAWQARVQQGIRRRRALLLAAMAFCFAPLALSLHMLVPGIMADLPTLHRVLLASAALPCAGAVAVIATSLRSDASVARQARTCLVMLLLPVASVLALAAVAFQQAGDSGHGSLVDTVMLFMMAGWLFAGNALVSYTILRGEIFGMEARLKITLSRGVLYGTFVAVFFVVSKLTESWVGQFFGAGQWVLGAVVAGLLLFALTPLQRLADRFADRVMPGVPLPARLGADERLALYRTQVHEAWSDGQISLKERRMLEAARSSLGITHQEAGALEAELVRMAGGAAALKPPLPVQR